MPEEEPIAPDVDEVEEKLEVIKERRRSSVMAMEGRERRISVVESIATKVRSLSTASAPPPLDEKDEEEAEEEEEEKPGNDVDDNKGGCVFVIDCFEFTSSNKAFSSSPEVIQLYRHYVLRITRRKTNLSSMTW